MIVGLVAPGVPASTLLVAALVLACPLMMLFMMHGMQGTHGDQHEPHQRERSDDPHDHPSIR